MLKHLFCLEKLEFIGLFLAFDLLHHQIGRRLVAENNFDIRARLCLFRAEADNPIVDFI
jgi:hypothetical protein